MFGVIRRQPVAEQKPVSTNLRIEAHQPLLRQAFIGQAKRIPHGCSQQATDNRLRSSVCGLHPVVDRVSKHPDECNRSVTRSAANRPQTNAPRPGLVVNKAELDRWREHYTSAAVTSRSLDAPIRRVARPFAWFWRRVGRLWKSKTRCAKLMWMTLTWRL
jgi:hypothetical protein